MNGMRDDEFYHKLLERLVLRFQGSFAYLGNMRDYSAWSKAAQDIQAQYNDNAVRAMIRMIAYAVVEEIKAVDASAPIVRSCPCGQRHVRDEASAETQKEPCSRCGFPVQS